MARRRGLVALVVWVGLLTACYSPAMSPVTVSDKPTESPAAKSVGLTSPAVPPGAFPSPSPSPAAAGSPIDTSVRGEVTVFAASSLADAFKEIGDRFRVANPGSQLSFNFGASTQLRLQLEQGAKADIFASANQAEVDKAKGSGVIGGQDRVFARNRLAVIFPKARPIGDLRDLAKPGLKFVTAAQEVPIGVYTQDVLDRMVRDPAYGADFKDRVNSNIVSREPNVRQIVAKISLGEGDAAVVYSSDVTPDVAANIGTLTIPDQLNTLATYPIALAKNPPNPGGAEAFVSYVLGPEGQAVLKNWGFASP